MPFKEENMKIKRLIGYFKSLSFHLRWLFASPQARYAYLWAKTKKQSDLGSAFSGRTVGY
jgi:hypothetical protein